MYCEFWTWSKPLVALNYSAHYTANAAQILLQIIVLDEFMSLQLAVVDNAITENLKQFLTTLSFRCYK